MCYYVYKHDSYVSSMTISFKNSFVPNLILSGLNKFILIKFKSLKLNYHTLKLENKTEMSKSC